MDDNKTETAGPSPTPEQQQAVNKLRAWKHDFAAKQLEGLAKMLREGMVEAVDFSWAGGHHINVNLKFRDTVGNIIVTREQLDALKREEDSDE